MSRRGRPPGNTGSKTGVRVRQNATSSISAPWWQTEGLVIAGGWHPLAARIRRGIPSETVEEDYAWEYSDEHVRRLKQLGVTVLLGQFDRGFGEADQAEDQDRARLLAGLCHQHGIRHGVYLANTVYFESMLKDHPECGEWVVQTHDNRRVHYGGLQTFRWVACLNSPGWRLRMKRAIEQAIRVVKTDLLHFDNLAVWPEPDSCHCEHCQKAFRAFLGARYPDAESQKRRFGIAGFETFRAPNYYLRFTPPWDVERFDNPLMQEWIEFRQWTVTDYIADLAAYARGLNPGICIDSNGQSVFGFNQALIHGIDQEAQAAHVDFVFDENPDIRPDDEPGAADPASSRMRGALFFRRTGKPCVSAYRDEAELAFNLAFRGHPGINARWGYSEPGRAPLQEAQPGVAELLEQFQRSRELYVGAVSAARVGVWRSRKSLAFVSTDTHLSAAVVEQLLFANRMPFSIVMDGCIEREDLSAFDLLILPDVEFISAVQVERLTAYVAAGGSLLITERSGAYTGEPRKRSAPAFAHLFAGAVRSASVGTEEAITFDPNRQFAGRFTPGQPAVSVYGKGRVAYLPALDYVHRPRAFRSGYNVHYDGIDSRYWKEPRNRTEILEAIEWLAPSARSVRTAASPELRLDLLRLADGRVAIPLLRSGPITSPRDVPLSLQAVRPPEDAKLYAPGREPCDVAWSLRGDRVETLLPNIRRHGVLVYTDLPV